jgi:hypothetical protein
MYDSSQMLRQLLLEHRCALVVGAPSLEEGPAAP